MAKPEKLLQAIKQISGRYSLPVLGPNSLGLQRPRIGLNVSMAHKCPPPGRLAFISQSATLANGILDFAASKNVGFSTFVSAGAQADIDIADLIDFLSVDPFTTGIVLYLESVMDGRKFVSAARAFARTKPLVVVKGGKYFESRQAALTHSGVLAGEDLVYDAVFKRSGLVRVDEILELFNVTEAISKQPAPASSRLAIISNAGGPAVMATDTLIRMGGRLAELNSGEKKEIRDLLPQWARVENPVDLLSDASEERYATALETCLRSRSTDGVLVILTPQFATAPEETAEKLVAISKKYPKKPVLACWMGSDMMAKGREILNMGGIPTFVTPEHGVKSFLYLYRHGSIVKLLTETPANIVDDFDPQYQVVEEIMERAASEQRFLLTERESKEIFEAYDIPSPPMDLATTPEQALEIARSMGFPVVMKLESNDVTHKGSVGGVLLNVEEDDVEDAFRAIRNNLKEARPDAHFAGVTLQPMIHWPGIELALGAKCDPTFGSVILFGAGGRLFEAMEDFAVGLPPLNQNLAARLMAETKICRYDHSTHGLELPYDLLEKILVKFSHLITDFPQIREVDINPFYAGRHGGLCLDGRIVLDTSITDGIRRFQGGAPEHLAIAPYPVQFTWEATMKDGTPYLIRPIKPEDEPLLNELFGTLSEKSIRLRFFQSIKELTHEDLARYCQVDYYRELALVAEVREDDRRRIVGVGRITMMPEGDAAEMAFVVGDPWHGQGIGSMLMIRTLEAAEKSGLKTIYMNVLRENSAMKGLSEKFGFYTVPSDDNDILVYRLDLGKKKPKKSAARKKGSARAATKKTR
jgi:acetyltransferase